MYVQYSKFYVGPSVPQTGWCLPVSVPVNSAKEHCSVRQSGRAVCSVVKVSSKSGAERTQTAAVNQFRSEDFPFSDSSWEV